MICMAAHFQDIKMYEAIYLIFDYKTTLVNKAMLKIDIERNLNGNYTILRINMLDWLIFWYLTPLSAIFQLYHGDQF